MEEERMKDKVGYHLLQVCMKSGLTKFHIHLNKKEYEDFKLDMDKTKSTDTPDTYTFSGITITVHPYVSK